MSRKTFHPTTSVITSLRLTLARTIRSAARRMSDERRSRESFPRGPHPDQLNRFVPQPVAGCKGAAHAQMLVRLKVLLCGN
jgi:hypothetical protein